MSSKLWHVLALVGTVSALMAFSPATPVGTTPAHAQDLTEYQIPQGAEKEAKALVNAASLEWGVIAAKAAVAAAGCGAPLVFGSSNVALQGCTALAGVLSGLAWLRNANLARLAADPPDLHYQHLYRLKVAHVPAVRAGKGVSAKLASKLHTLLVAEAVVAADEWAAVRSYERSTGAQEAGNSKAAKTQLIAAAHYSKLAVSGLSKELKLLSSTSRLVAHSRLARLSISVTKVQALQAKVSKKGLPAVIAQALHALGESAQQISQDVQALVSADATKLAGSHLLASAFGSKGIAEVKKERTAMKKVASMYTYAVKHPSSGSGSGLGAGGLGF